MLGRTPKSLLEEVEKARSLKIDEIPQGTATMGTMRPKNRVGDTWVMREAFHVDQMTLEETCTLIQKGRLSHEDRERAERSLARKLRDVPPPIAVDSLDALEAWARRFPACSEIILSAYQAKPEIREVQSLSRNARVPTDPLELEHIAAFRMKRKNKHDTAIADFESNMNQTNETFEAAVEAAAKQFKMLSDANMQEIHALLETLSDPSRMIGTNYAGMMEIQEALDLDRSSGRRLQWVETLGERLEAAEEERRSRCEHLLQKLTDKLLEISLITKEEIELLVEGVAHEVNVSALESKESHLELLEKLRITEMERQRMHSVKFEELLAAWRTARHNHSMEQFTESYVNSQADAASSSRWAIMDHFSASQRPIHSFLLDQMLCVGRISIKSLSTDLVGDWKQALSACCGRIATLSQVCLDAVREDSANAEQLFQEAVARLQTELYEWSAFPRDQLDAQIDSIAGPALRALQRDNKVALECAQKRLDDHRALLSSTACEGPASLIGRLLDAVPFVRNMEQETVATRDAVAPKIEDMKARLTAQESALEAELSAAVQKMKAAASEASAAEALLEVRNCAQRLGAHYQQTEQQELSACLKECEGSVLAVTTTWRDKVFEALGLRDFKSVESELVAKEMQEAASKQPTDKNAKKPDPKKDAGKGGLPPATPDSKPSPEVIQAVQQALDAMERVDLSGGEGVQPLPTVAVRPPTSMNFAPPPEPVAEVVVPRIETPAPDTTTKKDKDKKPATPTASKKGEKVAPPPPPPEPTPEEIRAAKEKEEEAKAGERLMPLVEQHIDVVPIDEQLLSGVYRNLRQSFAEHWLQIASECTSTVSSLCTACASELSKTTETRAAALEVRVLQLETHGHRARIREINRHADLLHKHVLNSNRNTQAFWTKTKGKVTKFEEELASFQTQEKNRMQTMGSVESTVSLNKKMRDHNQACAKFMDSCAKLMAELEDSFAATRTTLVAANETFLKTLKPLESEGTYSEEELRATAAAVEDLIAKFDAACQDVRQSDMDRLRTSVGETCSKLGQEFQALLTENATDLEAIEAYARAKTACASKTTSLRYASDEEKAEIDRLLDALEKLAATTYDSTERAPDTSLAREALETFERLRLKIYLRCLYLDCLKNKFSAASVSRETLQRLWDGPFDGKPLEFGTVDTSAPTLTMRMKELANKCRDEQMAGIDKYWTHKGKKEVTRPMKILPLPDWKAQAENEAVAIYKSTEEFVGRSTHDLRFQIARLVSVISSAALPLMVMQGAQRHAAGRALRRNISEQSSFEMDVAPLNLQKRDHNLQLKPTMANPSNWPSLTKLDEAETGRCQRAVALISAYRNTLNTIEVEESGRLLRQLALLAETMMRLYDSCAFPEDLIPGTQIVVGEHRSLKGLLLQQMRTQPPPATPEGYIVTPTFQPMHWPGLPLNEVTIDFALKGGTPTVLHSTPRPSDRPPTAAAPAAAPAAPKPGDKKLTKEQQKQLQEEKERELAAQQASVTTSLTTGRGTTAHVTLIASRNRCYDNLRTSFVERIVQISQTCSTLERAETKWAEMWSSMVRKLKPV